MIYFQGMKLYIPGLVAVVTLSFKLDPYNMKFQWSRTPDEVKEISFQQVEWLLQGLEIEQKKAYHQVKINYENSCF